jgi:hypothetical protein
MFPGRRRLIGLALALGVGTVGLSGCAGGSTPPSTPAAVPSRVAQLEPASMNVVRIAFCDLMPPAAVTRALGGRATSSAHWANGQTPPLAGTTAGDVTHEFGCAWTRGGEVARAWVFARPVTTTFAAEVISSARAPRGCNARPAPTFGHPGVLQTCTEPGKQTRVRYAGLFGATWLSCEVEGPRTDTGAQAPADRADPWCTAVANALNTP